MRPAALVLSLSLALLPSVALADNIVVNPDFQPAGPVAYPGYSSIPGWLAVQGDLGGNYNSGSNTNAGPFYDNGNSGTTYVAFVQAASQGSNAIMQTLALMPGQGYTFSYEENARSNGAPIVTVSLQYGLIQQILTPAHSDVAVGGNNPFTVYSGSFTAAASSETLVFQVDQPTEGADVTALFANVDVAPTPEPSSLMLLGTGVLGLAGAARRRFGRS